MRSALIVALVFAALFAIATAAGTIELYSYTYEADAKCDSEFYTLVVAPNEPGCLPLLFDITHEPQGKRDLVPRPRDNFPGYVIFSQICDEESTEITYTFYTEYGCPDNDTTKYTNTIAKDNCTTASSTAFGFGKCIIPVVVPIDLPVEPSTDNPAGTPIPVTPDVSNPTPTNNPSAPTPSSTNAPSPTNAASSFILPLAILSISSLLVILF